MRKTFASLCLSASILGVNSSYSQGPNQLNYLLTTGENSWKEEDSVEPIFRGIKEVYSPKGYQIIISALRTDESIEKTKKDLTYTITDTNKTTLIHILDNNADGLSIHDELFLTSQISSNKFLRINVSYPKKYRFLTYAEIIEDGKVISEYTLDSEKKTKNFGILKGIINVCFVGPKIEKYCYEGNEIYLGSVKEILNEREPKLPFNAIERGLEEVKKSIVKIKNKEQAEKALDALCEGFAESLEKIDKK